MAEKQQDLRIWWEKFALRGQLLLAAVGLVFALIVSIRLIDGAVELGQSGHDWLGGALVAASAVGMVTAFIKGRSLFSAPTPNEEKSDKTPSHQPSRKQPSPKRLPRKK